MVKADGKIVTPEHLDADLAGREAPAEVLQATGRWLAGRLAADGFGWLSTRSCLESAADGRSERIGFEGSRNNRAGASIEVRTVWLRVSDAALGRWRRQNPELTVPRPDASVDIVCWSSYYDLSRRPQTILTHPAERVAAAEALLEQLRVVALPWFATTRDPAVLANAVPEAVLRPTAFAQDLLEFLVSRELNGQAEALIHRFTSISPAHEAAFAEGVEMARAGERPAWHTPPALGWSSRMLGLV